MLKKVLKAIFGFVLILTISANVFAIYDPDGEFSDEVDSPYIRTLIDPAFEEDVESHLLLEDTTTSLTSIIAVERIGIALVFVSAVFIAIPIISKKQALNYKE